MELFVEQPATTGTRAEPVRALDHAAAVVAVQRDDQWSELESMAAEWARADANDPEPWYLMGLALYQLERLPEAQHALECALAFEPTSSAAWARLALVYGRQGLTERASQIELHLTQPNPSSGSSPLPALSTSTPCALGAPSSRTP